MRIRIINEKDWERSFELDKSIIRVGSQVTCDVYVSDQDVPALLMQITRSGTIDTRYTMRFFADNITLTRGDQSFPPDKNLPYEVLDGDKVSFSRYRMIIELESDRSRVRQSEHMRAEMFLSSRDLSPDSPISGGMLLKNLGTQRPCQFRLNIRGIPQDCLYSSPMPYLHPGASSSVGFTISHLKTKPGPGFHTVSITLSAPDDYYGEMLEFNQDIYVYPVFDNLMILEDDTDKLSGAVKNGEDGNGDTLPEPVTVQPDMSVRDSGMMNLDESVFASNAASEAPVRVLGKDSKAQAPAFEEAEDEEELPGYRRKKERVVVIRSDDNLFEGENANDLRQLEDPGAAAPETAETAEGASAEAKPAESAARAEVVEPPAPVQKTVMPKPEPVTVPEEPQPAHAPKKKAVKFNPKDIPVFSAKNDAFFDEEPEVPAAPEKEPETAPDEVNDLPQTEAEAAPEQDQSISLSVEAEKPKQEKKPRKKKAVKEPAPEVHDQDGSAASEEPAPNEQEQDKNILVLGAAPSEEQKQEKKSRKKNAAKEQKAVKPEEVIPEEQPVAEEATPVEEVIPEEAIPEEQPAAEEATPVEEVKPEEAIPEEQPAAEEVTPAEEVEPEEETPEEQPAAEEATPVEEVKPEEAIPEEQPAAEEVTPAEEVEPEEETPEEQPAAEEVTPIEEAVPEEETPEEPPAAEEVTPVEEAVPEEETPEEQPAAEEVTPVEEVEPEDITPEEEESAPAEENAAESKPPVPVYKPTAGFDEFSGDDDGDEAEEKVDDAEKPAFLVMKGGSFD